jgi:hypothetical protein
MSTSTIPNSFLDALLEPLTESMSRDQASKIAALRADEVTQAWIDDLATKANQGTLTEQERADYDSFLAFYRFISVLQARAQRLLKS